MVLLAAADHPNGLLSGGKNFERFTRLLFDESKFANGKLRLVEQFEALPTSGASGNLTAPTPRL